MHALCGDALLLPGQLLPETDAVRPDVRQDVPGQLLPEANAVRLLVLSEAMPRRLLSQADSGYVPAGESQSLPGQSDPKQRRQPRSGPNRSDSAGTFGQIGAEWTVAFRTIGRPPQSGAGAIAEQPQSGTVRNGIAP
jgi:hypothetical protein